MGASSINWAMGEPFADGPIQIHTGRPVAISLEHCGSSSRNWGPVFLLKRDHGNRVFQEQWYTVYISFLEVENDDHRLDFTSLYPKNSDP